MIVASSAGQRQRNSARQSAAVLMSSTISRISKFKLGLPDAGVASLLSASQSHEAALDGHFSTEQGDKADMFASTITIEAHSGWNEKLIFVTPDPDFRDSRFVATHDFRDGRIFVTFPHWMCWTRIPHQRKPV